MLETTIGDLSRRAVGYDDSRIAVRQAGSADLTYAELGDQVNRRAFAVNVLECPRCGGRMRLVATIGHSTVVRRVLDKPGVASAPVRADPADRPPERLTARSGRRLTLRGGGRKEHAAPATGMESRRPDAARGCRQHVGARHA